MKKEAYQILDQIEVGAVASFSDQTGPLLTPLHFVRFEDQIFFATSAKTDHAQNFKHNSSCQFAAWNSDKQAVYISGEVLPVTENLAQIKQKYQEKFGDFLPAEDFFGLKIGQLDEKKTTKKWFHFIA